MRSRSVATVLVVLTTFAVAGCSHGDNRARVAPSTSPSPTLSATPSPTSAGDPLTGGAPVSGPVVGVKVDNAVLARPFQRGLTQAAIVYQELVEGGSTRFLAIFESRAATKEVGPIRSARESDIELLRGFGRPAIAFSGANTGVLAIFAAAARAGYVYDASRDKAPSLFRFGGSRRDANNYFAVPARLGARIGGSEPRDIGWRFGPAVAGVATPSFSVPFSPVSVVRGRYDARRGTWLLSQGSRVIPVAPSNVVIQYVTTKASRFYDIHGKNTPFTVTVGSGRVVVLRDGQRVEGTWRRSGYGPTRFLDASGNDIPLKAGRTWVMLLPSRQAPAFR